MSFDYGQRHSRELESAAKVAKALGAARHLVISAPGLGEIGGSALTSDSIEVPKGRSEMEMETGRIPPTYVPARNTIFLSYALAWAETLGAADIFIGVNAVDYSGYPDCRPEFIEAFGRLANLAVAAAVEGRMSIKIHTPLISLTKAGIIGLGARLGVDYSLTWSCYSPDAGGVPCGRCDSCILRARGFREAGSNDPLSRCG
jgi:7-cyano-7-deazaguanine synthase